MDRPTDLEEQWRGSGDPTSRISWSRAPPATSPLSKSFPNAHEPPSLANGLLGQKSRSRVRACVQERERDDDTMMMMIRLSRCLLRWAGFASASSPTRNSPKRLTCRGTNPASLQQFTKTRARSTRKASALFRVSSF